MSEVTVIAVEIVRANGNFVGQLEYSSDHKVFYREDEDYIGEWSTEDEAKAAIEKDLAPMTVTYGYRRSY